MHLITDVKLIPWYCVNVTMTLCKYCFCYGNIMNMFQGKSLKLQCKKQPVRNNKTPFRVLMGFSDLRFLISTYEGLSFQWSFFPRQGHTTHRNIKSLIWYIYLKNLNTSLYFFYKHTCAKTDNNQFFMSIRRISNIWASSN